MWLSPMHARWLGHLFHASASEQTLSTYAEVQQLRLADLLAWEQHLASQGILVPPRHRPARFVTVVVQP